MHGFIKVSFVHEFKDVVKMLRCVRFEGNEQNEQFTVVIHSIHV